MNRRTYGPVTVEELFEQGYDIEFVRGRIEKVERDPSILYLEETDCALHFFDEKQYKHLVDAWNFETILDCWFQKDTGIILKLGPAFYDDDIIEFDENQVYFDNDGPDNFLIYFKPGCQDIELQKGDRRYTQPKDYGSLDYDTILNIQGGIQEIDEVFDHYDFITFVSGYRCVITGKDIQKLNKLFPEGYGGKKIYYKVEDWREYRDIITDVAPFKPIFSFQEEGT